MASKSLTPQEFENQYLGRPKECTEGGLVKQAETARERMEEVMLDPVESYRVFQSREGGIKEVQTYYDVAFDKAFEDIPMADERSMNTVQVPPTLALLKRLKRDNICWAEPRVDNIDRIDFYASNAVLSDGRKEMEIWGGVVLDSEDKLGNADHEKLDRKKGRMDFYISQGSPPAVGLRKEALSWQLAAINLAGGIARTASHIQSRRHGVDYKIIAYLQDLFAIQTQVNLADHLSKKTFRGQVKRTIESQGVNETNFMRRARIEGWSQSLTDLACGEMTPAISDAEGAMRSWLSRAAALRYFAEKKAGKLATAEQKMNVIIDFYTTHGSRFGVQHMYAPQDLAHDIKFRRND